MSRRKKIDPYERTEGAWAAERAYILEHSTVATERTLARRRKLIEKRGGQAMPLHLMDLEVILKTNSDVKPEKLHQIHLAPSLT